MTARYVMMLLAGGVIEIGAFHLTYADLIALHNTQGVPSATMCGHLSQTLERDHVTRGQLDRMVAIAAECGDDQARLRGLRRLASEYGDVDPIIYLQLADALRQAGSHEEASQVYARALRAFVKPTGAER